MEFNVQNINDFIKNARKMLLIIIAVIFMLIFIRGCINQITFYKEDIEYLQVIFKCYVKILGLASHDFAFYWIFKNSE